MNIQKTGSDLNLEPFVDADRAANFLGLPPRRILEFARAGKLPGYAIGAGRRHTWRFRLSELAAALCRNTCPDGRMVCENEETSYSSKPAKRPARSR